jgi:cardiolipin synthase
MFVEHHLIDLRRDRFRPAAWVRYVRRALAHARERAMANPAAVRSILFVGLMLFLGAVAGAAVLALAVDAALARVAFAWTVVGLVPMIGLTLLHVDLVRAPDGTPLDALGWPSAITLTRVALVPAFLVFMVEHHFRLAFAAFMVAIASDILDGWVARRFHQETRFGAILDPLSDILCSFWLFVGMFAADQLPLLPFGLAVARTALLLVGGSYLYLTLGPVRIHSTVPGKVTGLLLTALVTVRLGFTAFGSGQTVERLTPLVIDALSVLLGFTFIYAYAVGWVNLRRLQRRTDEGRMVTDIRFGA